LAKWPSTDSATVFQRTLRSTAWVRADRNWGSGCLVDRHRRHILTAYHVVRDSGSLAVCFPAHDANGKEITDRAHYHARMWIAGRVVKQDERHDLALLALDSLPPDVVELPLAARSPDPGENVHTVGTAGMTGPLWVYSHGNVRQVCQREYDFDSGQHIASWVILTQNPTNPGDSGGPLVNDRAELIGVTSGGEPRVDLVNWFIDLREIKVFLTDLGR
jgi:S1-C subfamily serine protease